MNVEEFREYCLLKKGVTEEFPFDKVTLVYKVMGKMFAIVPLERFPSQVNLKCDPERAMELRESYDGIIMPAFHMSKTHWNTLFFEQLPTELIIELTEHSYELIVAKFTKKVRAEWEAL
ncbi:MAG: MmcQ/YjbR family DNA-binding protein [Eudoraea sp.]|nr:MmcQ/YjbR family DNA-binding protein [Muriicola sp.]NNE03067.1 MmcQ/YjbR family DNA-binding protein [Eudoraea sp.]